MRLRRKMVFILGISSIIRPLPFYSASNVDIGVTIGCSAFLFVSMFTGKGKNLLELWEGVILVALYAGYISYLVIRG